MHQNLSKVKTVFDKAEKVLILLHQFPDGDTIASSLALAEYLKRDGKEVELAVKGEIPAVFSFLPGVAEIGGDFLLGDFDLVVAVDCGDANRTGFPIRLEKISTARPFVNIDHHAKNNLVKLASVNLIDETAAAAAEIVWELLEYMEAKIDSRLATYILAGIYFDTGGFHHPNVTGRTLNIASQCLRCGGRIGLISQCFNGNKSSAALKLWGVALQKLKLHENGVVTTFITLDDMEQISACADDASGIVNLINSVPAARVAILFLEMPDGKIKTSLRTESDDVDVSKLARLFGGGGHKKAAGFTLEGEAAEAFRHGLC